MKPIYECLDYLLKHLKENRYKPEGQRIDFDVDHKVLPELGLMNHEEFKGLIDMLVEDHYAYFLDGKKDELENYKARTLITPKGIDFVLKGGYETSEANRISNESELKQIVSYQLRLSKRLNLLTALLAIGTIGLLVWEILKFLIWERCQ